jgi:hypothetical protein
MSFVEKLKAREKDNIYAVYAPDITGETAYYFVIVDSAKSNAFVKAVTAGPTNLEEYGTIIESGYGEEASQEVKDRLMDEYGYEVKPRKNLPKKDTSEAGD